MTADDLETRIRDVAVPLAASHDVEVLDVAVKGARGRRLVRVTADVATLDAAAGLDIDTIATLSRELGAALDAQDLVPGAYDLEVSSPGADRALQRPRDFARNIGREVRLHHVEGHEPAQRVGVLVAASETDLTLEIDGSTVDVPLEAVDHGKVVLPW